MANLFNEIMALSFKENPRIHFIACACGVAIYIKFTIMNSVQTENLYFT